MPPAVDPWPDAEHHWVPDPEATVASPISQDIALTAPVSPPAAPTQKAPRPATVRPARAAAPSRASMPSRPSTVARPPTAGWQPPPAKARKRGGMRVFQVLLSILVLVAVPVVTLLVAYSLTSGVSFGSSLSYLIDDLGRLLN
jgi:molecular chaperone DnaK